MTHADGRVFIIQGSAGEGVSKWIVAKQLGVDANDLSSERHFHNAYDPAAAGQPGEVGRSGQGPLAVQLPSADDLGLFERTARAAGKPYRTEINYLLPDGSLGQTTVVVTPTPPAERPSPSGSAAAPRRACGPRSPQPAKHRATGSTSCSATSAPATPTCLRCPRGAERPLRISAGY